MQRNVTTEDTLMDLIRCFYISKSNKEYHFFSEGGGVPLSIVSNNE